MKIIKRNGAEVAFDVTKIENAIRKANNEVSEDNRLKEEQIRLICQKVTALAGDLNRAVNVEEIQDFVENQIMDQKAFAVARKYITYRYTRALVRKANTCLLYTSRKLHAPARRCVDGLSPRMCIFHGRTGGGILRIALGV